MQFKVTKKNGTEYIIGAVNNRHLEVSVLVTDDVTTPKVEGRAYIFEGKEFTEYNSWNLGQLFVGEMVTIEAIENTNPTEPSNIEFSTNYRRRYTNGTKEFIRDLSSKVKERTKRLNESINHHDRVIKCSFCHKIEGEVKSILPRSEVAVCNECIVSHYKILMDSDA